MAGGLARWLAQRQWDDEAPPSGESGAESSRAGYASSSRAGYASGSSAVWFHSTVM